MIRVLVLDVDHPGEDGLQLTLRMSRAVPAPRIVLYSNRATPRIRVAAAAAGVDAVVRKTDDQLELLGAIRDAAARTDARLTVTPNDMRHAASRLAPTDRAILAMVLAATAPTDERAGVDLDGTPTLGRRLAASLKRPPARPA